MVLDIAVATLIVTAVAVPLVGISIILAIYFQMNNRSNEMNNRSNEMLRILAADKLELGEKMKDLDRDIKTVDTTFRKHADEMSQSLAGDFAKVNSEIGTVKYQVGSHSEAILKQAGTMKRIVDLLEQLQKSVQENIR